MPPLPPSSRPELARLARRCEVLVWAACVVALFGPIVVWSRPDWIGVYVAGRLGLCDQPFAITPTVQVVGALAAMTRGAVLAFGLAGLVPVFRAFRDGALFSRTTADAVRRLGFALMAIGCLDPLVRIVQRLMLSAAGGAPRIAISIGVNDIAFLTIGIIVLALGTMMREAHRLSEENSSFI